MERTLNTTTDTTMGGLPPSPVVRRSSPAFRHFGLAREPFADGLDPAMWYPALGHADGLARLHHALTQPRGLAVVQGDDGYGKSVLKVALLSALRRERAGIEIAALDDPRTCRTDAQLLRAVLARFGLPLDGRTGREYLRRCTRFFETAHLRGRSVLLVVDDADRLSGTQLDTLHALLAAAPPGGSCLHLVLFGAPTLAERIARRESLAAHLGTAHTLNPLNRDDTAGLIAHRLHVAGWSATGTRPDTALFTEGAVDALHVATSGVPGAVVRGCALSLTEARFLGADRVDAAVVAAALTTDPRTAGRAVDTNITSDWSAATGARPGSDRMVNDGQTRKEGL